MMGLSSMIARSVVAGGSLKYLVLVNPGSAINAQRGEDYILLQHWSVPLGKARTYVVNDIVDALLDRLSGDTYSQED